MGAVWARCLQILMVDIVLALSRVYPAWDRLQPPHDPDRVQAVEDGWMESRPQQAKLIIKIMRFTADLLVIIKAKKMKKLLLLHEQVCWFHYYSLRVWSVVFIKATD